MAVSSSAPIEYAMSCPGKKRRLGDPLFNRLDGWRLLCVPLRATRARPVVPKFACQLPAAGLSNDFIDLPCIGREVPIRPFNHLVSIAKPLRNNVKADPRGHSV